MRAVDTDVLVRLVTGDDLTQAAAAEKFVSAGALVSHLVLAETLWVLASLYDRNTAALTRCAFLLTPNNRERLATFAVLRQGSLIQRLDAWRRLGLYRQTVIGQLALLYAIIFRRI